MIKTYYSPISKIHFHKIHFKLSEDMNIPLNGIDLNIFKQMIIERYFYSFTDSF